MILFGELKDGGTATVDVVTEDGAEKLIIRATPLALPPPVEPKAIEMKTEPSEGSDEEASPEDPA